MQEVFDRVKYLGPFVALRVNFARRRRNVIPTGGRGDRSGGAWGRLTLADFAIQTGFIHASGLAAMASSSVTRRFWR